MPVKFSEADINNIIKLRIIDNLAIKAIADILGTGYKPIKRILDTSGFDTTSKKIIKFTESQLNEIYNAYASGIGAKGIADHIGMRCSEAAIIRVLKVKFGTLRNRSEQQQARMDKSTPEQIAALTANAHKASKGRKATIEEMIKRASTKEGVINSFSTYEASIFSLLADNFNDVIPGKRIHTYNADFAVGSVTVEVFGGGWAISDKRRIDRYINRTKETGKTGFHTIFVVLDNRRLILDTSKLIKAIKFARCLPTTNSKYWVIWGDTDGSTGFSSDIDNNAFVMPFVNIRDAATGRYTRIPREA